MILKEADEAQLENWDNFVGRSINGTLFHRRKFLIYHGDRFSEGEKFLVVLKGTTVYAQISLYTYKDESGTKIMKSPYGTSYGGFVFERLPTYSESRKIVELLCEYLKEQKVEICYITSTPEFSDSMQLDSFYFAMMEQGFVSAKRDIESMVCLNKGNVENNVMSSVRNKDRIVRRNDIKLIHYPDLEKAYQILYESRIKKFGVAPTHTKEEFIYLHENLSKKVYSVTAEKGGVILAGITCFVLNPEINSSFYFFVNDEYKKTNALTSIILSELILSQENGFKIFSFGTSSMNGKANTATFQFKEQFGRQGRFRETFIWGSDL